MSTPAKPSRRPERPWFSSGPTAKRPGWSLEALSGASLGRGNRSTVTLGRCAEAVERTREVLEIPADYRVALVPGSDTGAVEAAMWSMLGARPVQLLAYENFGETWAIDAVDHLKLNPEVLAAPYGELPELTRVRPDADLVFPWNGTTSGVRVPDGDFIADDRQGITICDATSAAFAMDLPWEKLDVTTFSFQKALGGEAGIGVMVLSPRAVERLESYAAPRPVPKLLRLQKKGRFDASIFEGNIINTVSMLTVEDYLDALKWASRVGGLAELKRRTLENYAVLEAWVRRTPWIGFLAADRAYRSETSVCLKFTAPEIAALPADRQTAFVKRFCQALEREEAGYDLPGHRSAPPGLRVWCGCTVEASDVDALTPWLEWAYATTLAELQSA
jgi:phosphoserine aminotransferase